MALAAGAFAQTPTNNPTPATLGVTVNPTTLQLQNPAAASFWASNAGSFSTFFTSQTNNAQNTTNVQATNVVGVLTNNTSGSANSATNFSGPLVGDVTGPQGATVAATVGGVSAANVASGATAANAAASANTASTIVKRDASGNFAAGTVTANLIGGASSATNATTATNLVSGASTTNINVWSSSTSAIGLTMNVLAGQTTNIFGVVSNGVLIGGVSFQGRFRSAPGSLSSVDYGPHNNGSNGMYFVAGQNTVNFSTGGTNAGYFSNGVFYANVTGTHTGNGSGLTGLNAASGLSGSVPLSNGGMPPILPSAISLTFTNGMFRFCDVTNGSDSNSGFTSTLAKKTLDGMWTNGLSSNGMTYIFAPGIYTNGTHANYFFTNCAIIADPATVWSIRTNQAVTISVVSPVLFQCYNNFYLQGGIWDAQPPASQITTDPSSYAPYYTDPIFIAPQGCLYTIKNSIAHGSSDVLLGSVPAGTNYEINNQWDSYWDIAFPTGGGAGVSYLVAVNTTHVSHSIPSIGAADCFTLINMSLTCFGCSLTATGGTGVGQAENYGINCAGSTIINLWNTQISSIHNPSDGLIPYLVFDGGSGATVNVWGHSYPESQISVGTLNQNLTSGTVFPSGQLVTLDTYGNYYLSPSFSCLLTNWGNITATGFTNPNSYSIEGYYNGTSVVVTYTDSGGRAWRTNTVLTGANEYFTLAPAAKITAASGLTGNWHAKQ